MARFGFTALRPVEPIEADLSRTVDPAAIQAKREITPAKVRLDNPTFRPGINDKPAEAYSPSFLQVLDRVLGGDTITEARRNLIAEDQATKQKAASLAEVRGLMGQVLTDPRERLAYLANPEEWVKAVATNYAASNVGAGDTRVMPHYGSVTAPKVFESADSIISATPDEMTVLGRREPSFKEQADADIKERLAERALARQCWIKFGRRETSRRSVSFSRTKRTRSGSPWPSRTTRRSPTSWRAPPSASASRT